MLRIFTVLFLSFILFSPANAADQLSTTQQDEVRKLVRETLLTNPEILMEAMNVLQQRQEEQKEKAQKAALLSLGDSIENGPLTPIAGNPDGDVTMIEFFDYQCGYCKRAFPGVMEVINSDKNIRYVLKEFAILGPESEVAARAALAAQKQDKYFEMHTALMTIRGRLNTDKIIKIAEDVGLDVQRLKTDMQGDDVSAEILSTRAIAQRLNITGTPAFIIGDQIIPGAIPPEGLKEAIAKERQK
ncbi:DSBA oxidoreductase [Terasakiella brassicae]|uniref:DSBA oxidoreductase n=1 Tax=Terasakiella brassicae TaxID=1634917 RepID=A0A917C7C5_9PROT|nr:DsbA family protein [Terasakiella brassicae]GGF72282.1 DSBA oxidoreductase [Terasakiella brassicae]